MEKNETENQGVNGCRVDEEALEGKIFYEEVTGCGRRILFQ